MAQEKTPAIGERMIIILYKDKELQLISHGINSRQSSVEQPGVNEQPHAPAEAA